MTDKEHIDRIEAARAAFNYAVKQALLAGLDIELRLGREIIPGLWMFGRDNKVQFEARRQYQTKD